MAHITSSSLGNLAGSDGPVSFSDYSEGGSRTEEIRGSFVKNTDDNGQYTYVQTDSEYTLYREGDTRPRFDRYVQSKLPGLLTRINKACPLYFLKCPVLADRTRK